MTKSLNGGVRSHASNPLPFDSIQALIDNESDYSITSLISELASNDPKRVASCADEVTTLVLSAESLIRLSHDRIRLNAERSGGGLLSTMQDALGALQTAGALLSLSARVMPVIGDAETIVQGGSHE